MHRSRLAPNQLAAAGQVSRELAVGPEWSTEDSFEAPSTWHSLKKSDVLTSVGLVRRVCGVVGGDIAEDHQVMMIMMGKQVHRDSKVLLIIRVME